MLRRARDTPVNVPMVCTRNRMWWSKCIVIDYIESNDISILSINVLQAGRAIPVR